ncbi:MAG: ABC transporter permease/substrate-binding protein [Cyclobacteriaceae bacterium]|nr:ABC transporter permease/substrate-binding protein [Cyclobacteriaceae bacterium HetDA_MAG_MS6]
MSWFYYILDHLHEVQTQTFEHLYLTGISLILASIVGITVGVSIIKKEKLASLIISLVGVIQTIPSLALLGFLLPVFGIGAVPAIIALFLYALLPIVRNTYIGIKEIDPAIIEAALGMGMSRFQLLRIVQIPIAFPVILGGIRTSAVINVGVATLCALIAAGGLGEFIFRGISLNNPSMILAGAIPASVLAIFIDLFLGYIQKHINHVWKLIAPLIIVLSAVFLLYPKGEVSHMKSKLTAGFNSEFIERGDGYIGLNELYDLPISIKEMEIGLMYEALENGDVDVIDGFSTDGRIKAYNLKSLVDDKQYFPPYFAAPLVHRQALLDNPSLSDALQLLSNTVTDEDITQLNYLVDREQQSIKDVAAQYLKNKQLPFSLKAGHHSEPDVVIGSKAFTESFILAHLFAMVIEGNTGLRTELKLGFGGTKLLFDALRTKEIDLYPEYTGTGLLVLLQPQDTILDRLGSDPNAIFQYTKTEFQQLHNVTWLDPLGFNNTFALMMRREHADSLQIETISDLSTYLQTE